MVQSIAFDLIRKTDPTSRYIFPRPILTIFLQNDEEIWENFLILTWYPIDCIKLDQKNEPNMKKHFPETHFGHFLTKSSRNLRKIFILTSYPIDCISSESKNEHNIIKKHFPETHIEYFLRKWPINLGKNLNFDMICNRLHSIRFENGTELWDRFSRDPFRLICSSNDR